MAQTQLDAQTPSIRLRAAMIVGSTADPSDVPALIERCATEPDFFVRDMLTWALTRMPQDVTVPALLGELTSTTAQARSQALHTLSKVGDRTVWPAAVDFVGDRDDEVARAAWRALVALVPDSGASTAAEALGTQLGRGDGELRRSLSRAILELGDPGIAMLEHMAGSTSSEAVSEHIAETFRLHSDPEFSSRAAVHEAQRVAALGPND